MTGVWQGEGANVVIDVAGNDKSITFDGRTYNVRTVSVSAVNGVIVFADVRDPGTLFTLHKHWDENHEYYFLDLLLNDKPVANLGYIRPL